MGGGTHLGSMIKSKATSIFPNKHKLIWKTVWLTWLYAYNKTSFKVVALEKEKPYSYIIFELCFIFYYGLTCGVELKYRCNINTLSNKIGQKKYL